MDILYRVQAERRENEETGSYIAYGIEAVRGDALCRRISDISSEEEEVKDLVALCNQNRLDIRHLDDVVEDWIG